jgi:hypothetical protein
MIHLPTTNLCNSKTHSRHYVAEVIPSILFARTAASFDTATCTYRNTVHFMRAMLILVATRILNSLAHAVNTGAPKVFESVRLAARTTRLRATCLANLSTIPVSNHVIASTVVMAAIVFNGDAHISNCGTSKEFISMLLAGLTT